MSDQPKVKIFLKEWREYRGLTTAQLAERMGIEPIALSRTERGDRSSWSSNFLGTAAEALGVAPADLLRDPEQGSQEAPITKADFAVTPIGKYQH